MPTNESTQRQQCIRKRRYRNGLHAKIAKTMYERDYGRVYFVRIYKCPWCKGWHLTSRARRN